MGGRAWTESELSYLREHYRRGYAPEIAKALLRSVSSVHQQARLNDIRTTSNPAPKGWQETMRLMNAEGYSDSEVAKAIGCSRRHTCALRRKLGLPNNNLSERRINGIRERTKQQCEEKGVRNLGEVRSRVFRERARRAGWPDDLRPTAVRILNALWDNGPMARREICEAIGLTWRGARASLKSRDPEGSHLGHLVARGLVVNLGRRVKGEGKGRSVYLYSLPLWIERGEVIEQETVA